MTMWDFYQKCSQGNVNNEFIMYMLNNHLNSLRLEITQNIILPLVTT